MFLIVQMKYEVTKWLLLVLNKHWSAARWDAKKSSFLLSHKHKSLLTREQWHRQRKHEGMPFTRYSEKVFKQVHNYTVLVKNIPHYKTQDVQPLTIIVMNASRHNNVEASLHMDCSVVMMNSIKAAALHMHCLEDFKNNYLF